MSHCFNTILPADSIEFCPSPELTHVLAVGTYKLEEATADSSSSHQQVAVPRRRGTCLLFEMNMNADNNVESSCRQSHELSMPGILDMKWSSDVLAIANAEGSIALYRLSKETDNLKSLQNICVNTRALCLSLDWAKDRSTISSDTLATSCSDGSIVIAKQAQSHLTVTDNWIGHEFESWVAAWDRWYPNTIYTGGDDCKLKGWDCREGYKAPIFSNSRFDGGVTSIQSNPHTAHVLAVGSYDAFVRIFDTRQLSKPIKQVEAGGGVWRVKWHYDSDKRDYLLAACMHNGFKVMDLNATRPNATVASVHFDEQNSLGYGVDWSHAFLSKQESLVGSCSFYNHQLQLWRVQHDDVND